MICRRFASLNNTDLVNLSDLIYICMMLIKNGLAWLSLDLASSEVGFTLLYYNAVDKCNGKVQRREK